MEIFLVPRGQTERAMDEKPAKGSPLINTRPLSPSCYLFALPVVGPQLTGSYCASLALGSSALFKVENKASNSTGGFGGDYAQVGTREQNTDLEFLGHSEGARSEAYTIRDARLGHPGLLRTEVPLEGNGLNSVILQSLFLIKARKQG